MSDAGERLNGIEPGDFDAAMAVVDALLDEREGQLTGGALHMLARLSGDVDLVRAALKRRAAWFHARGQRVPKLPKDGFTWE